MFEAKDQITFVKWFDNRQLIVGTNFDSAEVNSEVNRRSKSVPTGLTVPMPNVIKNFNSGMGGVDKLDWIVNKYRIMIRGKKWYWNLVTNWFDLKISNAHILYNLVQERKVDLRDFRRSIAVAHLRTTRKRKIVAPGSPSTSLRYDNMGHFKKTRDAQRRCQGSLCKSKPNPYGAKCLVALCKNCFAAHHTQ